MHKTTEDRLFDPKSAHYEVMKTKAHLAGWVAYRTATGSAVQRCDAVVDAAIEQVIEQFHELKEYLSDN